MKTFFLILATVALSTPAVSAEVGVRHTHGHTTSNILNGRSVTRSNSQGSFAEVSGGGSAGHNGGSGYRRVEVGSYGSRTRESYDFNSRTNTTFSENSTFSR
jgi:hypothetical protein